MCSEIFRLYRMAVSPCKLHVERTVLTQNQIQVHKETETESMNAESSGKFTGKELVALTGPQTFRYLHPACEINTSYQTLRRHMLWVSHICKKACR